MLFLVLFFSTVVIPAIFVICILNKTHKQDLRGKIVLVTGGSKKLGQQICIKLAQEGCKIIIVDILSADETLKKIEPFCVRAKAYKVDVSNHEQILELKQNILVDFGHVDILINNVELRESKNLFEQTYDEIGKITKVNINSVKFMTKCFIENMLERRHGHIVTISSYQGLCADPYSINYCSTKFAVTGFMISLKEYLRIQNYNRIKTTTIFPNLVVKENYIFDDMKSLLAYQLNHEKCADYTIDAIINNTPLLVIPKYCGLMLTLFNALPFFMQHFCRDLMKRKN